MGGIFSRPKPPPPPPPVVDDSLSRREKAAQEKEARERRGIAARRKARRGGGSRMLMTQARFENPNQTSDAGSQTKLGASRNPRDVGLVISYVKFQGMEKKP